MRNLLYLSLIVFASLLGFSCGSMKKPKVKDKTADIVESKTKPRGNYGVDDEISDILLVKHFKLCSNGNLYTERGSELIEVPDFGYEAFPEFDALLEPTKIDQKNGIAWKGYFTVYFNKFHRRYDRFNNQWSVYKNGAGLEPLNFDLTNIRGEWICKACEAYSPSDCNNTVVNALTKGKQPSNDEIIKASRKSLSDYFSDLFGN